MTHEKISQLCLQHFSEPPQSIERCAVGQGNYVYIVECFAMKYVFRCSQDPDAYEDTIYWLEQLSAIDVPVPKVIAKGKSGEYEYLILSYIEGRDIGLIYAQLQDDDKKEIAEEIVQIQNQVATLKIEYVESDWSWRSFVKDMLDRARKRIAKNGYFEVEKVDRLWALVEQLDEYFATVQPIAYLDDISSKNLLIHQGRIIRSKHAVPALSVASIKRNATGNAGT